MKKTKIEIKAANKANAQTAHAVLTAMLGSEQGVTPPARNRSSSFASLVADLNVGDSPASRVIELAHTTSIGDAVEQLPALREKLRNSVTSAVSAARRRVPGSDFSIEVGNLMMNSGMYVVALVRRTA